MKRLLERVKGQNEEDSDLMPWLMMPIYRTTGTMVSFEDFVRILNEEVELLPAYVHEELNGGVLADPNAYLHPGRLADDLYILGTYSVDPVFGRQIVLYYGSFVASLGLAGETIYRDRIRETVRHEFLHHLETRAGARKRGTLVEEDLRRMQEYYRSHEP